MVSNPFLFQWPSAPVADTSARLPPLAAHDKAFQQVHPTISNPSSFQWPSAPVAQTSTSQPLLAAQAHVSLSSLLIFLSSPNFPYQTLEGNSSMRTWNRSEPPWNRHGTASSVPQHPYTDPLRCGCRSLFSTFSASRSRIRLANRLRGFLRHPKKLKHSLIPSTIIF